MRKVEAATTLIARIVWYGGYTLLVYLVGAFVMGTSDVWEWSQDERGTIAWVWLIFGLISAGIGEIQAIDSIRDGLIAMFSDDEEPTP